MLLSTDGISYILQMYHRKNIKKKLSNIKKRGEYKRYGEQWVRQIKTLQNGDKTVFSLDLQTLSTQNF